MDESDSARFAVTARRWAVLMWTLSVATAVPTVVLLAVGPDVTLPSELFRGPAGVAFLLLALVFASVGVLIASRVPANRIGVVFCVVGLATALQLLSWQYADVGLHPPGRLPGASDVATFNSVFGEATAGLLGIPLLLFSTGRLPSRRWWPALASLVAGMLLVVVAGALRPGPYDQPFASVSNPLSIGGPRAVFDAADFAGWLFVLAGIAAGAVSLVVRRRRADVAERRQLELVLAVGALTATAAAALMATWLVWPHGNLQLRMAVVGLCFTTFPLAAGFAILRRGLVRDRACRQPHPRLRLADRAARSDVRGDDRAHRDRPRPRVGLDGRERHGGRRAPLPATPDPHAGRRRSAFQPCPLRRAPADGRVPRGAARRSCGTRGDRAAAARAGLGSEPGAALLAAREPV